MPDCLIFDFDYLDCSLESNCLKSLLTNVNRISYVRIHVFYQSFLKSINKRNRRVLNHLQ